MMAPRLRHIFLKNRRAGTEKRLSKLGNIVNDTNRVLHDSVAQFQDLPAPSFMRSFAIFAIFCPIGRAAESAVQSGAASDPYSPICDSSLP